MTGITLHNWAGNVQYRAERLLQPRTTDELCTVVAAEDSVRVLGTRHSFNELADTTAALVSLRSLVRSIEVDTEAAQVRVDGGVTYGELVPALDAAGLALPNLASLPHISVAGAVATATHGSGDANQTLASAVAAFDLVTADGSIRTIRRGDTDFDGTVVGLGAFGVVSSITLDCVPSYDLATTVYVDLPWDVLVDHVDEIHAVGYSVSIAPDWRQAGLSNVFVKVPADERPMHDVFGALPATEPVHPSPGVDPAACTDQLGVPGPWHARLPHFKLDFEPSTGEEIQSEYLLPQEAGTALLEALHELGPALAGLAQSTEIRTAAADDLWLSPAYERDVVAVHFTWRRDQAAVEKILPSVEEVLLPLGARPHWGKVSTVSPTDLRSAVPRFDEVAALIATADPGQKFANDHLRRIGMVPPAG